MADRELLTNLAPVVAPVVRKAVEMRMERKELEADKERKVELAKARSNATDSPAPAPESTDVQPSRESTSDTNPPGTDVQRLIEKETCDVCITLLEGLQDMAPDRRAQGLAEYGRFKELTGDQDVPMDELRDIIQNDLPVMREALTRQFDGFSPQSTTPEEVTATENSTRDATLTEFS